jgi:hypothetical protein
MQYLLMIYENEKVWVDMPEAQRNSMFGEYMTYTSDIKASKHFIAGDALQPVATATTVRVRNGKATVTDGPFAETKECLAGFYMIEARDLNEAIQIASRIPPAQVGSIEVRPIRPIREAPNAHRKPAS